MRPQANDAALDVLYQHPGHLLWRAQARVSAAVARLLPGRLDLHAYAAMLALAESEPASQQHLARLTGVSGTTVGTVAEALAAEGLVERVRNPQDRRSYLLTRTPEGHRAVPAWAAQVDAVERALTASLSPEEVDRLRASLRTILADQLEEQTPVALARSIGFLVTRAQQRVHRVFLAELAPLGIEPRHFGSLRALGETGPITQGTLAGLLDVSPATVVEVVDHLERGGLVERRRDPADRRAYRVQLTPRAHGVLAHAMDASARVVGTELGGLTDEEQHDLVLLLRRFLDADPDPDPIPTDETPAGG